MGRRIALLGLVLVLGAPALGGSAAAGGGCHAPSDAGLTGSTDKTVAIEMCAFTDTVTFVSPGDSVTWTNEDMAPHTVTGAGSSWGDDRYMDQGDEVSYTFEDEGVYPYFCALHPSMVGTVVVGDAAGMLGKFGGKVEEVDLTSASTDAAPPAGRAGDGVSPGAALSVALGLAAAAILGRFLLRRRVGATPAA